MGIPVDDRHDRNASSSSFRGKYGKFLWPRSHSLIARLAFLSVVMLRSHFFYMALIEDIDLILRLVRCLSGFLIPMPLLPTIGSLAAVRSSLLGDG